MVEIDAGKRLQGERTYQHKVRSCCRWDSVGFLQGECLKVCHESEHGWVG